MAQSTAKDVDGYLAEVPEERKEALDSDARPRARPVPFGNSSLLVKPRICTR
jgi:hypothetical protein